MVYKCYDCKKIFTSQFLLNNHKNREVSCNVLLACYRCNKTFTNRKSYDAHINKKYLCKFNDEILKSTNTISIIYPNDINFKKNNMNNTNNTNNINIVDNELEKLKIQLELKKIKLEEDKIKDEKEKNKIKLKEIEMNGKIKLTEIDKEKQIEIMKIRSEETIKVEVIKVEKMEKNKLLQMEVNDKKQEKIQETLEKRKQVSLELKELDNKNTNNITINNNTIINIDSITMNLENNFLGKTKYSTNDVPSLLSKTMEYCIEREINKFNEYDITGLTPEKIIIGQRQNLNRKRKEDKRKQKMITMFKLSTEQDTFIEFVINTIFNSPNRPNERFIYYHKQSDGFYGIVIFQNNKKVELIDFNKVLAPYINEGIRTFYNFIYEVISKVITEKTISKEIKKLSHIERYNKEEYIKEVKDKVYDNDELRKHACKVFEYDCSNYDIKTIKKDNKILKENMNKIPHIYSIDPDNDSASEADEFFYN
jgi:uncharacterized C2H2 Zn-finger protein